MTRILIVEDYPNLQELYKTVLEDEGFEVWGAKDGQEALAVAEEHEPDLILLDLLMQNLGGLEFLRKFDLEKHSHVKVLVFSNIASPELVEEAKKLGVSEYLLKAKYTPKEIVDKIRKTLHAK